MKIYMKHIITLLTLVLLVSCDDYLDVKPEDKFLEEDVFQSRGTILNALNGIYTKMTNVNSYGGHLTMTAVDVLAQRYKAVTTSHNWNQVANYEYETAEARKVFNEIWSTQYKTILSINNFLAGLETYPGVLTLEQENILKGEVLGLRAMLHFDLLRLYGPIYSVSPNKESIPYYNNNSGLPAPYFPANEVMALVLSDLDEAEILLADDAIITEGPADLYGSGDPGLEAIELDSDKFTKLRQYRFNYYAVKALQARVHLYAGNTTEALAAATFVIENATKWFPWTKESEILNEAENPDRTFSTEVIFGLVNTSLYDRYRAYFAPAVKEDNILAADSAILPQVFESNQNDYRYNPIWRQDESGIKAYRTFFKYADVADKQFTDFRFKQPLIRLTEMYYIAAETESNPEVALQYLNTVRNHRGLTSLPNAANLQNEILKEYKKEFFGEGQLFFYYKRLNVPTLAGGVPGLTYTMGSDQYVVPLPLSETEFR